LWAALEKPEYIDVGCEISIDVFVASLKRVFPDTLININVNTWAKDIIFLINYLFIDFDMFLDLCNVEF
jgi:hypothetical protein